MLQTCQQINAEAAPLFYGMNVFVFEAVPHLYAFLNHLGPRLPLVRQLGVASIYARPNFGNFEPAGVKLISHITWDHMFPLLAHATNLEVLYMNTCIYQSFSSKPDLAARHFYHRAGVWLWAMVLSKRDLLSIMRLPGLKENKVGNKQWVTTQKGQDEFLAELKRRLVLGQQAKA
jgi:hypothetical protein